MEIKEKPYYEMTAYQRSNNQTLIKGKLFLSFYKLLKTVNNENSTTEFYYATDLNDQQLFIIRNITRIKVNNDREIEDCNIYAMRIDQNVFKALMQIFEEKVKQQEEPRHVDI